MATLLVVDDEPPILDLLQDLFRGEGHKVHAAVDGSAAVVALGAMAVDLVVTDTMMPRLDGVGLVRWMRAHPTLREIPVILLSAAARPQLVGLEPLVFVAKPFEVSVLLDAVRDALEDPGA